MTPSEQLKARALAKQKAEQEDRIITTENLQKIANYLAHLSQQVTMPYSERDKLESASLKLQSVVDNLHRIFKI